LQFVQIVTHRLLAIPPCICYTVVLPLGPVLLFVVLSYFCIYYFYTVIVIIIKTATGYVYTSVFADTGPKL